MKYSFVVASAFGVALVATSHAQVAQAMACTITDSFTVNSSLITVSPTSTTSPPKWLDARADFNSGYHPYGDGVPYYLYGTHSYAGYVKVKWIGATPPSTTVNYGAKFAVWSLRNGQVGATLIKPAPGARWISPSLALLNNYLNLLPLSASVSSPGYQYVPGGDLVGGNIYTEPLPSVGSNGNWARVSDYVSTATFSLAADGYYYAYVQVVGVTQVTHNSYSSNTNGWSPLDVGAGFYHTRIAYKLVEVDAQPVM